MLIKNEAENLRRTLPKWAKIADYWIVGVDDANSDDSVDVIKRYLGHLPGEIVIVHFDGMGPTWTKLVEVGIKNYPDATHGILSDADYVPLQDTLDKSSLDVRCAQHSFSIWTEDRGLERNMDWIYRNLPGAKVPFWVSFAINHALFPAFPLQCSVVLTLIQPCLSQRVIFIFNALASLASISVFIRQVLRRTHQSILPPPMQSSPECKFLIPLSVEGRSGGWGDRSGDKSERCVARF
jgi:hypothetical protein